MTYFFTEDYEVVKEPLSRRNGTKILWAVTRQRVHILEMTGIEPVTCGLQSHRSPN